MLATLLLTACSSVTPVTDVKLSVADPVAAPQPDRPDAVKMHDMKWKECGEKACASPDVAAQSVKDRLSIARWMSKANHLLDYYEKVTAGKAIDAAK